jgi:regulatory protein
MKITALKQQVRDTNRVNVFVDGKYSFSFSIDQVLSEKLKVGLEIDDEVLAELKSKSTDEKLRLRAMNWVLLRPRSILETKQYLKRTISKRKVDASSTDEAKLSVQINIDNIIDEFVRRGWLDDSKFANWWVGRSSRQLKSSAFLAGELAQKGIDKSVVSDLLLRDNDRASLEELYAKIKDKPKYSDPNKLLRFLLSKGYSYSLVKEVLAPAGMGDSGD